MEYLVTVKYSWSSLLCNALVSQLVFCSDHVPSDGKWSVKILLLLYSCQVLPFMSIVSRSILNTFFFNAKKNRGGIPSTVGIVLPFRVNRVICISLVFFYKYMFFKW